MKYAVSFFFLGALISYAGFVWGGWGHLLHWAAFNCFLLAIGYAGAGVKIFAKQADGSIPVWVRWIYTPFALYTQTIWHVARKISNENPIDTVSGDLLIGRRLLAEECPVGIVNYVDLTAEFEDPEPIRNKTHYISLPVLDADVPDKEDLRGAISLLKPGLTFVHCAQGHGRTGVFTLALLWERGRIKSFDEGMTLLKKVRPKINLNRKQRHFIRQYMES
jgi:protein-tyrosine phosphatase